MLWLPGIRVFLVDDGLAANLDDRILFIEGLDVVAEITRTIRRLAAVVLACSYFAGGSTTGANAPLASSARLGSPLAGRLCCSRLHNRKGRQRASVFNASSDVGAAALQEHVVEIGANTRPGDPHGASRIRPGGVVLVRGLHRSLRHQSKPQARARQTAFCIETIAVAVAEQHDVVHVGGDDDPRCVEVWLRTGYAPARGHDRPSRSDGARWRPPCRQGCRGQLRSRRTLWKDHGPLASRPS